MAPVGALLLLIPGLILSMTTWIGYRNHTLSRMLTLVTILGVGYWYILPGTLFLLGFDQETEDAYLVYAESAIYQATLLVHVSFGMLLLLPTLIFGSVHNMPDVPLRQRKITDGRLDTLLIMAVLSTLGLFVIRFYTYGTDFVVGLFMGLVSPREVMTFENFSSGASESLLALWDIINIFISVFYVAALTWQRQIMSARFVGACLIGVISFLSTGTRSVLLLMLSAGAIASICRPSHIIEVPHRRRRVRPLISFLLLGGLTLVAILSMVARFETNLDDDPHSSSRLLINSVVGHNDMFRELVYVMDRNFSSDYEGVNFLMTPITFTMPSFLGFSKSIPSHLADFNMDRAGINIVHGSGNVFPGLLGDTFMCFGRMAPIVLLAFWGIVIAAFVLVTTCFRNSSISKALLISLLCYYFISFRNVQGSFGILLFTAVALQVFLSPMPWTTQSNITDTPT